MENLFPHEEQMLTHSIYASVIQNNENRLFGWDKKDIYREAVDCLVDGSALTGPCKLHWGVTKDGFDLGPPEVMVDYLQKDKTPEESCAEGAICYAAFLRGWNIREIMTLLKHASVEFILKHSHSLSAFNDAWGRDEATKAAKELL